ncbi:hypothetical protein [Pseudoruegeria aquimaris]|uniref:hypothetical protein n=1 Tax=Pseudoruegeria aquimaris TaxID=393663 RepID=UPI00111C7EC9|nr:hypothetical protein [Pseudoruegeria aquimaris]
MAQPLSAIDWLSDSIRAPVTVPRDDGAVADSAAVGEITVTPLDEPGLDAVGLLPTSVTGFPRDLWGGSDVQTLTEQIARIDATASPALQDLLYTLLLAELDPPRGAGGENTLFLARVDKLLEMGALEQSKALLERAGPDTSALFRRWFDVSLLTGTENAACDALRRKADIAPTFQARIFCLARNGDWNAAALTLETAKALGFLSPEEDALLARFLDPLLFEGLPPLPLPAHPTPLVFRMYEAIGQPIATASQPLAFAHSDLRPVSGWKAQIEAAERLARSGAIDENLLLGIYTERLPAASGGTWDRVAALQRFDVALRARNTNAIAKTLPPAWRMLREAGLETAFARLYGAELAGFELPGKAARIAYRLGLLSPDYEVIARNHRSDDPFETYLASVAAGTPSEPPAGNLRAAAVSEGFSSLTAPPDYAPMLAEGRIGEAILAATDEFARAFEGDPADASEAIALLRAVGLEDTARRAALEFLLAGGAA